MDHDPTTTDEPTDEEIREVLPDMTCTSCEETRNILDFYDADHRVNLVVRGDEEFGVVVDHGEIALQRDRKNL